MENFICDFFSRIGLGVNGFVSNLNDIKVKELFPKYQFNVETISETHTSLKVTADDGKVVFCGDYRHDENGHITNVTIFKTE